MDGSEETDFTFRQIQSSRKLILFDDIWKIYTMFQIKIKTLRDESNSIKDSVSDIIFL